MAQFILDKLKPQGNSTDFKVVDASDIEDIIGYALPETGLTTSILTDIPTHQRYSPFLLALRGTLFVYAVASVDDLTWGNLDNWRELALNSTASVMGTPQGKATGSTDPTAVGTYTLRNGDWWLCSEDYDVSTATYSNFNLVPGKGDLSTIKVNHYLWYDEELEGFVQIPFIIDDAVLSSLVGDLNINNDTATNTEGIDDVYSGNNGVTNAIQALNNVVVFLHRTLTGLTSTGTSIPASNVSNSGESSESTVQDVLDDHETRIETLDSQVAAQEGTKYDDIDNQKPTINLGGITTDYTLQGKNLTQLFKELVAPFIPASISSVEAAGLDNTYEVGEDVSITDLNLTYKKSTEDDFPTNPTYTYPSGDDSYVGPKAATLTGDTETSIDLSGNSFSRADEGIRTFTFNADSLDRKSVV